MVKIAVNGALGKMGKAILTLASASSDYQIAAGFENTRDPKKILFGKTEVEIRNLSGATFPFQGKGVLIDFSSPECTPAAIEAASKAGWGLVVGTTGLDAKTQKLIQDASKLIPIVYSANMSIGVNLLARVATLIASKIGKGFDIEITEAHHRHKKDAPSGTALLLARAIAEGKKWDLEKAMHMRQPGKTETERPEEQIGMQVIRAGEIVGDHTVLFAGGGETIELKHHAQSRDTFALGALTAAKFLSDKQQGLFNMMDVLGI